MKTESVFRDKIFLSKKFFNLFQIVKELETLVGSDRLDIEFAKKKSTWYLFQCRHLPKNTLDNKDNEIKKTLVNLQKKIDKLKKINPTISGKTTYFSNMADWNPAEMIGNKPKPLAISLYSELITDSVWAIQRKNYGYKNVLPNILMINLAGSPFIDLRTDINSFLPSGLSKSTEAKLVDHYLKILRSKPYLHDKIEFEIIPTCYDFKLKNKKFRFLKTSERNLYIKKLKKITNRVLNSKNKILLDEIKKVNLLDKKVDKITSSKISEIQKIFFLIDDCKNFGTLSFSGIARCAFIYTKFLKSLQDLKIVNKDDIQNIYASIPTITKKINYDYQNIKNSKKLKNNFINNYGHLRPSTYSITSLNYKEGFKTYFPKANLNKFLFRPKKFSFTKIQKKKIDKLFLHAKLELNSNSFLNSLKKSIQFREYAKFIFSKSINEIFVNLLKLGKEINISRDDLEFISIRKIISSYSILETSKLSAILKKEISSNKKSFNILKQIKFTDFLSTSSEIYFQNIKSSKGNFITSKKVSGTATYLKNFNLLNKLNNKIILLDNADPGSDFIFSHKIKGLVTKYGGANSHMAIRCLELSVPAIIGVGSKEFDQIKVCNSIEISCEQKTFKLIN